MIQVEIKQDGKYIGVVVKIFGAIKKKELLKGLNIVSINLQ